MKLIIRIIAWILLVISMATIFVVFEQYAISMGSHSINGTILAAITIVIYNVGLLMIFYQRVRKTPSFRSGKDVKEVDLSF